jgi:hypothetical protein
MCTERRTVLNIFIKITVCELQNIRLLYFFECITKNPKHRQIKKAHFKS